MKTTEKPRCPTCKSSRVTFKKRAREWECDVCERRFAPEGKARRPPAKASAPRRIFFSYGHDHHREIVERLREDLAARDHHVWIDYKEIGTWEDWREKILQGIHDSELAIAFLSKHSVRDPGVCRNEIAIAMRRFGDVHPVLLERLERHEIPVQVGDRHWSDLSGWQAVWDRGKPGEFTRWYRKRRLAMVRYLEGEGSRFADETRVLRQVLDDTFFDVQMARHVDGFTGRQWVFEEFERWLANRPGSRVWCLEADPGFGKTALAVQLTARYRDSIVASWFCDRQSDELTDPRRILLGMAFQLANRLPGYRVALLAALGLFKGSGHPQIACARALLAGKGLNDLFRFLFSRPLADAIPLEGICVLLIDGLDEATDDSGSNELARLLGIRMEELPRWVRVVVTHRPDPAVSGHLAGYTSFKLQRNDARNAADLQAYLDRRLMDVGPMSSLEGDERAEIAQRLMQGADGMLLYLRMVFDGLGTGRLDLRDLSSLDQGIPGLHQRYFSEFEQRLGVSSADAQDVRSLLELVVATPEPLTRAVAARVLGWNPERLERIRRLIGSYLVDTPDGLVVFHDSLAVWLRRQAPWQVEVEDDAGEADARLDEAFQDGDYESFRLLALVAAAPGPLPRSVAAEVRPWKREELDWIRALIGSYLVDTPDGLVVFDDSLRAWLRRHEQWQEELGASESDLDRYVLEATGVITGDLDPDDEKVCLSDLGSGTPWIPVLWSAWRARVRAEGDNPIERLAGLLSSRAANDVLHAFRRQVFKYWVEQPPSVHGRSERVAEAAYRLGCALANQGQHQEAEEMLRRALTEAAALSPEPAWRLDAHEELARVLWESVPNEESDEGRARSRSEGDRRGEARRLLRQVLAMRKSAEDVTGPAPVLRCLARLGRVLDGRPDREELENVYSSLAHRHDASRAGAEVVAFLHEHALSRLNEEGLLVHGDAVPVRAPYDDADSGLDRLRLAFGFREHRNLPGTRAALPTLLNTLGLGLLTLGRVSDARRALCLSLRAVDDLFGAHHRLRAVALNNLAVLDLLHGRRGDAAARFEAAREVYGICVGHNAVQVAKVVANLGSLAHAAGNLRRAKELYRDALSRLSDCPGGAPADLLQVRSNLALVEAAEGRGEHAAADLQSILEARTRELGEDHLQTIVSQIHYGIAVAARWHLRPKDLEHGLFRLARWTFGRDDKVLLRLESLMPNLAQELCSGESVVGLQWDRLLEARLTRELREEPAYGDRDEAGPLVRAQFAVGPEARRTRDWGRRSMQQDRALLQACRKALSADARGGARRDDLERDVRRTAPSKEDVEWAAACGWRDHQALVDMGFSPRVLSAMARKRGR
jgi:tetratricopeptide (TPR) repeat protein